MEGKGGAVGEIRRLNIIYFLSCMWRFDHPHLIRVDHLNRNGVFLRDVKRWLADFQEKGKSWPETFNWSCKRRYKKGYVWQDLLDDDLITPVSDNEYILKGSQMLSHSCFVNIQGDSSTIKTNDTNHEQSPIENSGFCSNLLLKKKKKKIKSSDEYNNKDSKEMGCSTTSKCSSSSSPHNSSSPQSQSESVPVGKSSKRRHLSMFRNLINCGAVNTNDAAHVRLNRDSNNNDSSKDIIIGKEKRDQNAGTVGSAGLFRTCMDQQKHQNHTCTTASKRADDRNQKAAASAYKPIRWPHCS
ncbi:PREDICTED: uncharacterized protein LOC101294143 [Fragaria vesca subsp. vesca]